MRYSLFSLLFVTFFIGGMRSDSQQVLRAIGKVERGEVEKSSLNRCSSSEYGALRVLVQKSSWLPLVERLLEAGADPNFDDGVGVPLSCAGSKGGVELLLRYGADPQKCGYSTLRVPWVHYKVSNHRESDLKDALAAMTLLLKQGESVHRYDSNQKHLLYKVSNDSIISVEAKEAILSFLICNGSNPNDPWDLDFKKKLTLRNFKKKLSVSVYERLESGRRLKPWATFIRKKEQWDCVKQLLVAKQKEQSDDCYIHRLPLELVHFIGKLVLNHKNVEIP